MAPREATMQAMRALLLGFTTAAGLTLGASAAPAGGDGGAGRLTPAAIDGLIAARWDAEGLTPSARTTDAEFLRRVALDLTGTIPTLEETRAFLDDPATDKRARLVERLLQHDGFSAHWTDVLELAWLGRPTRLERNNRKTFRPWLHEQLADDRGFDAIVRDMLLATGDVREEGATGYLIRYQGKAGDVAGAASKHFLGVQIQCAECHDHPFDVWKQQDFRDFAAFFGQTAMRPVKGPDPKRPGRMKRVSYEIVDGAAGRYAGMMRAMGMGGGMDGGMDGGTAGGDSKPYGDGKGGGTKSGDAGRESGGRHGDGGMEGLTPRQRQKRQRRAEARRKQAEKKFKALEAKNPERAKAIRYAAARPRALGDTDPMAVGERSRREAFADWLTGPGRVRFARATVNRIWSCLFGRGIVDPVDDLSARHEPTHPELLDRLAAEFIRNGYHLRELLRLLTATQAYQLSSMPSDDNSGDTECYARGYIRQLSPEQAFASLFAATVGGAPSAQRGRNRARFLANARKQFVSDFVVELGNDEGETVDAFQGSIPQALAMLNGMLTNPAAAPHMPGGLSPQQQRKWKRRMARRRRTPVTIAERVVRDTTDPAARVRTLFLAVLVREPSPHEVERCVAYLASADTPLTGAQDLVWALVNSTEFLVNR